MIMEKPKIKYADLLRIIDQKKITEKPLNLDKAYFGSDEEKKKIDNQGLKDFYFLRKFWSWVVAGYVTISLLFQICLIIFTGLGILKFEGYNNLLALITGENFIQILGLGYIIVNFLYPKIDYSNK